MFIVVPFIISAGLAIVAEANLRFGGFCPKKKCRHSTGSFSFFGLDYQTLLEFSKI